MFRSIPLQRSALTFPVTLLILLATQPVCTGTKSVPSSPENTEPPTGELIDASECKWYQLIPLEYQTPPNQDCIEYTYRADSTLVLRHINAAFNCCPGVLFASFEFKDSVITIEEHEADALCDCDCLYDLDFEIRHLVPASYFIKVIEPYVEEDEEPLEFQVDLSVPTSGRYCVERDSYPWNLPVPDPAGALVDYSDCKVVNPAQPGSFDYTGKECIQYCYHPDFSLDLLHINAWFNCCPGEIHGTVTFNDMVISIREREEINGCRCHCPYDLDYYIENLRPAIYQIEVFWGDALEPHLSFEADLSIPISGIYCEDSPY